MKGLILAGGLGKRLRPLTFTGPKQTLPIANKPVIHSCIEDLTNAGIKDIGIIVGYTPERINAIKGLAHAVYTAEDFLGDDDFVVYLGDNMIMGGVKKFVEDFKNSGDHAKLLLSEVDAPSRYGVVTLDDYGNVVEIEEKPEFPKSNLAIAGIYFFRPDIIKFAKSVKPGKHGELQLTDAIKKMVESNRYRVTASIIDGWWDDLGRVEDVLRANYMVLSNMRESEIEGTLEENVSLIGFIKINKGSIIRKDTVIKGPVVIGKNCGIGPNSYIGPYTSIGDNTTIVGGEVESSIITGDTTIKLDGKIVESLIGKNSTIVQSNKLPKGYRLVVGENSYLSL